MDDEEFHRLSTLYLEDAIGDTNRRRLNHALATSPSRIEQFNDLRLLVGMIHEHGHTSAETPTPRTLSPVKASTPTPGLRWLAAAAILVLGFVLGNTFSDLIGTGRDTSSQTPRISAVQLVNGSFESPALSQNTGYPVSPGLWTGEGTGVTGAGQKIKPFDGKSMLCFNLPPQPAPRSFPATRWQLVQLKDLPGASTGTNATLRTRFNHKGDPTPGNNRCLIELYALDGPLASAEQRLQDGDFLSSTRRFHVTDTDPDTWETIETSLAVPEGTRFLLVGIGGYGTERPQPFGGNSYVGHYADGAELYVEQTSP